MVITAVGIFGAALLYGDGIITPAISVLSAVEGIHVVTPIFDKYVRPIACAIIVVIFMLQKNGTGRVGKIFGPIMLLWFLTMAAMGVFWMSHHPSVLEAVLPTHAIDFFARNGVHGFLVIGSVFLVVTGGEALYADMGHFGRRPIRLIWFFLVLPALMLNYFGQGALLMAEPHRADNPFFHMAPEWGQIPLIVLATFAACIASQAVIAGAFSLTRQAVQLGFSPRVEVKHTSAAEIGQIYVPGVNFALMLGCLGLILEFETSSNLSAAYGIAVSATMMITTILFYFVAHDKWRWPTWVAAGTCALFLAIDLAFFSANIVKIADGGWFPLAVALLVFTMMTTWKRGREILSSRHRETEIPQVDFIRMIQENPPHRVPGTAVFMYRNADGVPSALLHNLKHNRVLHERVVFLTVISEEIPVVPPEERVKVTELGHGFWRVIIRYGFIEDPDVPVVLNSMPPDVLKFNSMETTYFLGRETIVATKRPGMFIWQERLFSRMIRNERTATSFFKLPPNRVVELGEQIEI